MRVLLATGEASGSSHLDSMLEATGYEVVRGTCTGVKLLSSIEHAGQLHVAVLSQAALGKRWPKLIRELRGRAPDLPIVVLLDKRADQAWRPAILAGAFDAVPASVPETEVLQVVSRALAYACIGGGGESSLSNDLAEPIGQTITTQAEAKAMAEGAWNAPADPSLPGQPGVMESDK